VLTKHGVSIVIEAKLCVHKHVQYEESQILPMFQSRLEKDHLVRLGEFWEQAKKTAPTLPHPGAPNTAPANIFTGPLLAFFDKIKETVAGGAQHAPQQPAS
jgi:succinate dehydrogenase/fumarate reductase-like Fe-S protein